MAKRVIESLVDDIDGSSTADETMEFAVDGVQYTIDLSSDNAQKFRDALAPYIKASRRVGGRQGRGTARTGGRNASPDATKPNANAVREWAKSQGITVNDRGRVPQSVVDQYEAAAQG